MAAASVVMMASNNRDGQKPVFHDFLGMSCAAADSSINIVTPAAAGFSGEVHAEASSAAGRDDVVPAGRHVASERQCVLNPDKTHAPSEISDLSTTAELASFYSGKKRSTSDSAFMGTARGKMLQLGMDAYRNPQSSLIADVHAKQKDDEILTIKQPQKIQPVGSTLTQAPLNTRQDSILSVWDRSFLASTSHLMNVPPRQRQYSQRGTYVDKISSSALRDSGVGPSLITQPAADEGSRTGMKGSSIGSIMATACGVVGRGSTGMTLDGGKSRLGSQGAELEPGGSSSHPTLSSVSHQMTIFYAGQAHVFDDVNPKKADAIMALAGSSGRSWSTTYSSHRSRQPPSKEAQNPSNHNDISVNKMAVSQDMRSRLASLSAVHGYDRGGQKLFLTVPDTSAGGSQGNNLLKEAMQASPQVEERSGK